MVTLFFILSISYTFVSMIWFIIGNEFATKNIMPQCLQKIASFVKRLFYWSFDETPLWKRKPLESNKVNDEKSPFSTQESAPTSKLASKEPNNMNEMLLLKLIETLNKMSCSNCGQCQKCLDEKEKEKKKKKEKELRESNAAALNYVMCFLLMLTMFSCNLTIWLMISNPPKDYIDE